MKAQEFVVERLRGLFSKYEEVKIRYEYRINTQSHIVEIMPLNFFEGNKGYLADEDACIVTGKQIGRAHV